MAFVYFRLRIAKQTRVDAGSKSSIERFVLRRALSHSIQFVFLRNWFRMRDCHVAAFGVIWSSNRVIDINEFPYVCGFAIDPHSPCVRRCAVNWGCFVSANVRGKYRAAPHCVAIVLSSNTNWMRLAIDVRLSITERCACVAVVGRRGTSDRSNLLQETTHRPASQIQAVRRSRRITVSINLIFIRPNLFCSRTVDLRESNFGSFRQRVKVGAINAFSLLFNSFSAWNSCADYVFVLISPK